LFDLHSSRIGSTLPENQKEADLGQNKKGMSPLGWLPGWHTEPDLHMARVMWSIWTGYRISSFFFFSFFVVVVVEVYDVRWWC